MSEEGFNRGDFMFNKGDFMPRIGFIVYFIIILSFILPVIYICFVFYVNIYVHVFLNCFHCSPRWMRKVSTK